MVQLFLLLLCPVSAIPYVAYNGHAYATVEPKDPQGWSVGCQEEWLELPAGWQLAPDTSDVRWNVIAAYPWETHVVAVANGAAYRSANGNSGNPGDMLTSNSAIRRSGNQYRADWCNMRILMYKELTTTAITTTITTSQVTTTATTTTTTTSQVTTTATTTTTTTTSQTNTTMTLTTSTGTSTSSTEATSTLTSTSITSTTTQATSTLTSTSITSRTTQALQVVESAVAFNLPEVNATVEEMQAQMELPATKRAYELTLAETLDIPAEDVTVSSVQVYDTAAPRRFQTVTQKTSLAVNVNFQLRTKGSTDTAQATQVTGLITKIANLGSSGSTVQLAFARALGTNLEEAAKVDPDGMALLRLTAQAVQVEGVVVTHVEIPRAWVVHVATQLVPEEANLDQALSVLAIVAISLTTCWFFVVIALLLLRFRKMRQSQQETRPTNDLVDISFADPRHGSVLVDISSADPRHGSAELVQKLREVAEAKVSSVSEAAAITSAPEIPTDEGTWAGMFSALFDGGFCASCSSQQAQQAADLGPRPEEVIKPKTFGDEEIITPFAASGHGHAADLGPRPEEVIKPKTFGDEEIITPFAASGHGHAAPIVSSSAVVKIPRGEGTPVAMFSAHFDGGPVERMIRRVHKILCDHSYEILMVDAGAGESFGDATVQYLNRLKEDRGVMIAVCTGHYGEKTSSKYSSHEQLKFAHAHGITVLPLKMGDTYPPKPPCGKNHLDENCVAHGYINFVFRPDVVPVDCREMSDMDIACAIARHLCKLRDRTSTIG